jgi:Ca2+-binding EF-hand superfamily protein
MVILFQKDAILDQTGVLKDKLQKKGKTNMHSAFQTPMVASMGWQRPFTKNPQAGEADVPNRHLKRIGSKDSRKIAVQDSNVHESMSALPPVPPQHGCQRSPMPEHRRRQLSRKTRAQRVGCKRDIAPASQVFSDAGCVVQPDRCSDWLSTEFSMMKQGENLELAQYRRDVLKAASDLQRDRARELASLRQQKKHYADEQAYMSNQLTEPESEDETVPGEDRKSISRRTSFYEDASDAGCFQGSPRKSFDGRPSLCQRSSSLHSDEDSGSEQKQIRRKKSLRTTTTMTTSGSTTSLKGVQEECEEDAGKSDAEEVHSVLSRLKPKLDRTARMHLLRNARHHSRYEKLLAAKQAKFDALTEIEQVVLQAAFYECDKEDTGTLDARRVRNSLAKLGLKGKTEAEKKEVAGLCQEVTITGDVDFFTFCFELVPRAREKLKEMQRRPLYEQFVIYDADGSGLLDEDEVFEIVAKCCVKNMDTRGYEEVKAATATLYEDLKLADSGQIDFEGFVELFAKIKEKVECVRMDRQRTILAQNQMQPEEVQEHMDELLSLHDSFERQDHDGGGTLDETEVRGALLEYGLMPRKPELREKVEALIRASTLDEKERRKGMTFHGFLDLLKSLRQVNAEDSREDLRALFNSCDKDGSGELNMAEVSCLITQVGLQPRSQEDQDEIKQLLLEVDKDGSGELDFDEFVVLVQQIGEKLRSGEILRQNETAKRLGFTNEQVSDLRRAFYDLDNDGNGGLCIDECRQTLMLLRKNMTSEELRDLFNSLDIDGNGEIDFEEFLQFWKIIDEEEPSSPASPEMRRRNAINRPTLHAAANL